LNQVPSAIIAVKTIRTYNLLKIRKSNFEFIVGNRKMKKLLISVFVLSSFLMTSVVNAHHSAFEFDLTIRDQTVEGVVVEFKAQNPHARIVLVVDDEKGKREIIYEGHSRNNYFRGGWRTNMVNVGDTILLNVAPMKDGSDGGYVLGVTTANGVSF
jgi:hypothetical protein